MNPVAKRTLAGIGVGLLVVGLFLYCPLKAVLPVMVVLSTLVQLEFYQLARGCQPAAGWGIFAGALWILATGLYGFGTGVLMLAGAFPVALTLGFFALCLHVTFNRRITRPVESIASTLFGFLYVPFLLSFFLLIIQTCGNWGCLWWDMTEEAWPRHGLYTLLALVAVTKFSDTGGFAFGLAFGKHKMCPEISPKKSWEGLIGSMVFAAATAAVTLAFARAGGWGVTLPFWRMLTYPGACAAGAVIALLGTAGDLVESRIMRAAGVKDSATFMPAGMGGFLDMFDSLLFIPALAYLAFVVCSLVAGGAR